MYLKKFISDLIEILRIEKQQYIPTVLWSEADFILVKAVGSQISLLFCNFHHSFFKIWKKIILFLQEH